MHSVFFDFIEVALRAYVYLIKFTFVLCVFRVCAYIATPFSLAYLIRACSAFRFVVICAVCF